jgi:two-component system, NtrC family, response regulator AtoC
VLRVVIIENDPSVSADLEKKLVETDVTACSHARPEFTIDELASHDPGFAVIGPSLDEDTCMKCTHKIKIFDPSVPILILCKGDKSPDESERFPFEGIHLVSVDLTPEEMSKTIAVAFRHKAEYDISPEYPIIIGQSDAIRAVRQKVHDLSNKTITVLITGETGTGKELVARSIHFHSLRRKGPLFKISCGTLPDDLLESEVFGFQRGAFTGAYRDKPGRIELAHGGTLFIDEIGNLSLNLQAKFLQVLEDKAFVRLGGIHDKIVDARVIAATNSDLLKKVREGQFRKDLYYRLNVIHIKVPPLRERNQDIPLLTHYFAQKYCFELKKDPMEIPMEIASHFQAYQWPGNVRELENMVRRAVALRDWGFVVKDLTLGNGIARHACEADAEARNLGDDWRDDRIREAIKEPEFSLKRITQFHVAEAERKAIIETLQKTQWNRKAAAQLLGVSYKTLLNRIEEFGIKSTSFRS